MILRLQALDVDLELEIEAAAAELLVALLPSTWVPAGRRESAPLVRLTLQMSANKAFLVDLTDHDRRLEMRHPPTVSPAKAGAQSPVPFCAYGDGDWIPAFAGMTVEHPRISGRSNVAGERILAAAKADADPRLWLGRLEQEIVAAVARRSRCLWLHAGAVLLDGRALVLPGSSFAGKSTLVDALVGRGARYLSDEWAAIDPGGRVHAMPRPPRLREGRPREAVEAAGDWPLLATAFLRYHPRPAGWPRRLAPADALAELFPHAIGPSAEGSLAAVATILGRPVFAGWRGEAELFLDGWLGRLAELSDAA
jgi:hypothetical protein